MSLLRVYLTYSEKTDLSFPGKIWISLSGVEENFMKDKNTGVQHVMGVLCTPDGTLVVTIDTNTTCTYSLKNKVMIILI